MGVLEGQFARFPCGSAVRRLRLLDPTRLVCGRRALGRVLVLRPGIGPGLEEAGVLANEVGPAAGSLDDVAAAVHGDGRGGQPVDEVAVVADQDQGAVVGLEQLFQLVERVHVEVVGRFVEDQHIGRLGQGPGQQQAVALAARQGRDRLAQLALLEQEVLGVGGDVFGDAAHEDGVAAAGGEGVPQGHVAAQAVAGLVEIDGLEVGPQLDRAFVGREFAEQDLDQGGLARAVGADDGEAVAADDARGEGLDDGAVAEGLGDPLQFRDQLAGRGPGIDAEVELARDILEPFGAVCAQGVERARTPLVAGAAGGDGAVEGLGLALDGLAEALKGLGLFLLNLGRPFVEGGEALVEGADAAAFEPVTGLGDAVQEGAVVADDEHREPGLEQFLLEQFDGQDVEVVGRLVEQQQVGLFGKGLGEGGAAGFAAGQVHGGFLGVEAEGGQPGLRGPAFGPFRGGVFEQGPVGMGGTGVWRVRAHPLCGRRQVGFLRDIGEAGAGLDGTVAGVGLDQAHDHLHQGRLAGPVPADEGRAGARLNRDVDAVKQWPLAILEADVVERDERGTGSHANLGRAEEDRGGRRGGHAFEGGHIGPKGPCGHRRGSAGRLVRDTRAPKG